MSSGISRYCNPSIGGLIATFVHDREIHNYWDTLYAGFYRTNCKTTIIYWSYLKQCYILLDIRSFFCFDSSDVASLDEYLCVTNIPKTNKNLEWDPESVFYIRIYTTPVYTPQKSSVWISCCKQQIAESPKLHVLAHTLLEMLSTKMNKQFDLTGYRHILVL